MAHSDSEITTHDLFCALCISSGNMVGALLMSITTLNLQDFNILPRLAKDLFNSIGQSVRLKFLNLSHNIDIFADNTEVNNALKSMLLKNTSIQTLKMEHCNLLDSVCIQMSVGLLQNKSIKELYLHGNKIGNNGACIIFESLVGNKSLEILDLSSNAVQFWNMDFHVSIKKLDVK